MISKDMICLEANLKDKTEIVHAVGDLMNQAGKLFDKEGYIEDVFKREEEISTNLGDYIAMPHARSVNVKEAGLVFIRLKNEVKWGGNDSPVKLVFGIAAPKTGGDIHLEILAKLARKLIYDEFKEKLFKAEAKEELLAILEEATGGLK